MRTLTWMTFVLTLAFAGFDMQHSSLDQAARNISSADQKKAEVIMRSASVFDDGKFRDLENVSKFLPKNETPAPVAPN